MGELSLLEQIWEAAVATSLLEWLAFFFSVAYVILAARQNIWCWPFGLVGVICTFLICVDPDVRLYSDATLQVYYFGMSIYGWASWRKRGNDVKEGEEELAISQWSMNQHLIVLVGGSFLAILLGYFWTWMDAALPYIDAFTTSFSIIATYMVARKILENWLYWIVIDAVCIFVYWHRELYLISILFLVYCIIAVFGYLRWKKEFSEEG